MNKNINDPNGMKSPLQSENSKNSNLNGNIQSDNEMLSNEELPWTKWKKKEFFYVLLIPKIMFDILFFLYLVVNFDRI